MAASVGVDEGVGDVEVGGEAHLEEVGVDLAGVGGDGRPGAGLEEEGEGEVVGAGAAAEEAAVGEEGGGGGGGLGEAPDEGVAGEDVGVGEAVVEGEGVVWGRGWEDGEGGEEAGRGGAAEDEEAGVGLFDLGEAAYLHLILV